MRIQEDSRSMVRNMGSSGVFVALALSLLLFEPASCQGVGGSLTSPGAAEVSTPVGAAGGGAVDLPIPIPTSLRFYEGADLNIDSCSRDEVSVNGSCHRVLTQGPCQDSDFVLLDPSTHEGYCAARLCAPDRIFVFSDQLCHDPFSSTHCPGSQELFQTAFGTPICQCPDGFLEGTGGSCVPPLTPTHTCPPAQVLWSNSSRLMQVCGPDPCGRLNLDRPLPSPPFVPSLADGICYQLGQVTGVCPHGSFYALDLEARRGVCAVLQDAGYVILDAATQRLYRDLYGPFSLFTLLDPSLLLPSPPLPPTHLGQDPVALLTGVPHTPLSLDGGQAQQSGGLVLPGLAGQGAATLDATKGGAVTQITFGSVAVPGALEQHAAAHQGAARPGKRPPHPRNHYIAATTSARCGITSSLHCLSTSCPRPSTWRACTPHAAKTTWCAPSPPRACLAPRPPSGCRWCPPDCWQRPSTCTTPAPHHATPPTQRHARQKMSWSPQSTRTNTTTARRTPSRQMRRTPKVRRPTRQRRGAGAPRRAPVWWKPAWSPAGRGRGAT
ncbi:uncharacterized protein LOC123513550 [Portunus trituberculatus]|uniref:uncharacterized protein LOC123513550 n=1 Tax=Portunus trituberculatus TaxID=210409 RepID=UPI001E1CC5C8|nr:uncharacterized protein LOC123513550 [Portunus trituberculatus]